MTSAAPTARTSIMKTNPQTRPSTVAKTPGPHPPTADAISTAGKKNRYEAWPARTDSSARRTASAAAIAANAMP